MKDAYLPSIPGVPSRAQMPAVRGDSSKYIALRWLFAVCVCGLRRKQNQSDPCKVTCCFSVAGGYTTLTLTG